MNLLETSIQFELPDLLGCPKPTELRNIARDEVRLLVTTGAGQISHTVFNKVHQYLQKGDVLVVNTSATRASAFHVGLPDKRKGMLHFSTRLNNADWLVEIREIKGDKTIRWKGGEEEMIFNLYAGSSVKLKRRFYEERKFLHLWIVEFNSRNEQEHEAYMAKYGQPIKYDKLSEPFPLDYYQTFFSTTPGSSEMPSAGRGFTENLVAKLMEKGVVFAPFLLHTGVSSLEENESPYPEYMEINAISAAIINKAKKEGSKIIAVGTTGVRAIESAVNEAGEVTPYLGYTDLYIYDNYRMKIIDGLLTGFHEPKASHLKMLQSLAGFDHIEWAYNLAIENNYFWHQFGDLHLILP